jgi:hypothetical protein
MKRLLALAAVVALCGAVPTIALAQMTSAPDKVTIALNAQNDSGESGAATLAQDGKDVLVWVRVNGGSELQPDHIHQGTCANLNPVPKYPLSPVKDGVSFTRIKNLQLSSLLASSFAINVHKSPQEIKTYVACGDITTS